MESDSVNQTPISTDDAVGFPTPSHKPKKKSPKWVLILLVVLLIAAAAAAFLIYNSNQTIEPESTPQSASFEQMEGPTPEPEATPEPIDRSEISIQILNGTGITGEANYLETQLKEVGYEKIDKGNAPSQNQTVTLVTFATGATQGVQDEIMEKLGEVYTEVKQESGSLGAGIDVKIITGLRKGATPKASVAAKATATPAGTPKASSSPTASTTPKPTATP